MPIFRTEWYIHFQIKRESKNELMSMDDVRVEILKLL